MAFLFAATLVLVLWAHRLTVEVEYEEWAARQQRRLHDNS